MADAVLKFDTINYLGLPASFKAGDASFTDSKEEKDVLNARGDIACSRAVGDIQELSQTYQYCGADLIGELDTLLTEFGGVVTGDAGSWLITEMTINTTSQEYATIDFTFHNHEANAHEIGSFNRVGNFSALFPSGSGGLFENWDGFGIIDPLGISAIDTATPSSVSYAFSFGTHEDMYEPSGDHFSGQSSTPRADITGEYSGDISALDVNSILETNFAPLKFPVTSKTGAYSQTASQTSGFVVYTYVASASQSASGA